MQHVRWVPTPSGRSLAAFLRKSRINQGGTFWYCRHQTEGVQDCVYRNRRQAKVRRHWKLVHCTDPRWHPLFCSCLF
jgi:hypothetical protein